MNEVKRPKTYYEVGKEEGLLPHVLERYVKYMRIRWADDEDYKCVVGYAREWAQRFKSGTEYQMSDSGGKRILKEIDSADVIEEELKRRGL